MCVCVCCVCVCVCVMCVCVCVCVCLVIHSCEELSSIDYTRPEDLSDEVITSVSRQAGVLDRQLKSIEHVSAHTHHNGML